MKKPNVTNSDNTGVKRVDIYEEFCLWSAMPPSERFKLGIETQEQFVEFYKIGINTPTAWKKLNDYKLRVSSLRMEWGFAKTSAVIEGIYRAALKGNPHSQKLWLQYFNGFSEKQELKITDRPRIGFDDLLYLIEALPEEKRERHYVHLTDLALDSAIAKQIAEQTEEGRVRWSKGAPADWNPPISLETIKEEVLKIMERREVENKVIEQNIRVRKTSVCDDFSTSKMVSCFGSQVSERY